MSVGDLQGQGDVDDGEAGMDHTRIAKVMSETQGTYDQI